MRSGKQRRSSGTNPIPFRQIRKEGVTVLLAEQNLHFCAKVSDRAFVIDKGSVKYEGTMKDLLANAEIKEKYLAV